MTSAASAAFDLSPRGSWLDEASNVAFADPVSVAKVGKEPDATSLLAGGKSSCASGGCAGGTAGADAASALRAVASLFGDGTRSARWGSTSTPPLRALGPAISSIVGMGKKKEADAKEDDRGRCCDNAERDEVEQGAEVRLRCLVPPFGRSEGAPGALAGCEPEFRRELRGSSCCASSTNNPVASVRRDISRSRFPDNRSQNTNGEC